jgi:hypothetical protein
MTLLRLLAGEDTGGPQLRMLQRLKQVLGPEDFYMLAAEVSNQPSVDGFAGRSTSLGVDGHTPTLSQDYLDPSRVTQCINI